MTLNQIKKNIVKNGGRIVKDNDFRFLLNGVFYTENLLSPSRILYDFAEIDLPENFFDSAYYICINNKKNQFWHNEFDAFAKELIIFWEAMTAIIWIIFITLPLPTSIITI